MVSDGAGMATKVGGKIKRRWVGVWWKPWTWLSFFNELTDYKLDSIDFVKNPPPGCEFRDFELNPADPTAVVNPIEFGPEMDAHYDCGDK